MEAAAHRDSGARMTDDVQRSAARIAGVLYLFLMATGVFSEFYARGSLIVPGNVAQTAANITAHERLFRIGIVSNLITFSGDLILIWALFVVLKAVNRNVAVLATIVRIPESANLVVGILN